MRRSPLIALLALGCGAGMSRPPWAREFLDAFVLGSVPLPVSGAASPR